MEVEKNTTYTNFTFCFFIMASLSSCVIMPCFSLYVFLSASFAFKVSSNFDSNSFN